MGEYYLLSSGARRAVAAGRALQAAFLWVSLSVGTLAPDSSVGAVRGLLATYAVYSVAIWGLTQLRRSSELLRRASLTLSLVDLSVFTALLYLSSGADSPFFSPLLFLIVSGTLQWGSRGALGLGLAALLVFLPTGWFALAGLDPGRYATVLFVVRLGYALVTILLLTAFARHLENVVGELARLARPLSTEVEEEVPPFRACLAHALHVFQAKSALLVIHDGSGVGCIVQLRGSVLETLPLTGPPPKGPAAGAGSDEVRLLEVHGGRIRLTAGRVEGSGPAIQAVNAALGLRPFERALALPVLSKEVRGWLLVIDHKDPANQDLTVGAIVAAHTSAVLERWASAATVRTTYALQERIRLARDLHDGVLQFLSGVALQVDALRREQDLPRVVARRLASLKRALADEQQELRAFIAAMRPRTQPGQQRPLAEELERLAGRLERQWNIGVRLEVDPPDLVAPEALVFDIVRLIREAVANAVRHGYARTVKIAGGMDGSGFHLEVSDDGRGFCKQPGEAHSDLQSRGPRSLRERVDAFGGAMTVESSDSGAIVRVTIPAARFG